MSDDFDVAAGAILFALADGEDIDPDDLVIVTEAMEPGQRRRLADALLALAAIGREQADAALAKAAERFAEVFGEENGPR